MSEIISEKIVIAANFTIDPIRNSMANLFAKLSIRSEILFAPYNQIFQQLVDQQGLFHKNQSGTNIVFLRLEDLIESRGLDIQCIVDQIDKVRRNASDLGKLLSAAERFSVPLYVFFCPHSEGIRRNEVLTEEFKAIEQTIRDKVSDVSNLHLFETNHLPSRYRIKAIDNAKGNLLGHVPYSAEFMSALAVETVRNVDTYRRNPFKVLVLDCDNTLWDGVVGEDGVDGIGISRSRLFLQNFAIKQSESGMVVCLNSKNNESDVWEVFDKRKDMTLKKEHIVSSRINWSPKSENLRSIAEELQVGLESVIFIDDDPAVCSEVRTNRPEVFTVLLPSESDKLCSFFDQLWVFDKLKITQEDRERTQSYHNQVRRRELQSKAADISEFLKSLDLVCEISGLSNPDIPRVSQLTLRTNQFNSTTIRLSEADIQKRISDLNEVIWTVRVSDRFGDYGLVGVVIFEELQEALLVRSFMLSCRVLGRGVEHRIVKELGKKACATDLKSVLFSFAATAKNAPIMNFLHEIGEQSEAVRNGEMIYEVSTKAALECSPQSNHVQEKSAPALETQRRGFVPNTVWDAGRFQTYIEMAHSFSNSGALRLNGTAGKLSRMNLRSEFRAARTDTENKLTCIWEQLLNTNDIGTADDFFEVGGDSLVAVALFVEIEEQFGKSLPISILVNSPTIEKLAQEIEFGIDRNTWQYLVPIQPEGKRPPLFCMHAAGGNVLFYSDLAKELGSNQPLYGLQARGVADRSKIAHDSVEEMACDYIKEIRMIQPRGPYQLAGSSFGGLVAFEAALQLSAVGQRVSLLALFDTLAPGYSIQNANKSPFGRRITQIHQWATNTKNQIIEIERGAERVDFIRRKLEKIGRQLKRKILWKKNEFAVQYGKVMGRELPKDLQRNHRAIQNAEASYKASIYDGEVVLFRAAQQPGNVIADPFLGWSRFTTHALKTEDVPGTHGALTVYPFATHLAEKLDSYLGDANAGNNRSFAASGNS